MPADSTLITLLAGREGEPMRVLLRDGTAITITDIAWGYDTGDATGEAHITASLGAACDDPLPFFWEHEIVEVREPGTGSLLWPSG